MNEDGKVTINGKEYDFVELEDTEQYYIKQVQYLKARIAEAKFRIDQLSTAENAYTKALVDSVEKNKKDTTNEK